MSTELFQENPYQLYHCSSSGEGQVGVYALGRSLSISGSFAKKYKYGAESEKLKALTRECHNLKKKSLWNSSSVSDTALDMGETKRKLCSTCSLFLLHQSERYPPNPTVLLIRSISPGTGLSSTA